MSATTLQPAPGVLPSQVSSDVHADAFLIAVNISPTTTQAQTISFLQTVTGLLATLEAPAANGERVATVTAAFGPTFFSAGGAARFGIDPIHIPAGFAALPQLPGVTDQTGAMDVLFYVMSTSEAAVARFLRGLAETGLLSAASIERGYQRADRREHFGYLDGLRNVNDHARRREVVAIRCGDAPNEPAWLDGGSYLAYLKLRQDVPAMAALDAATQDQIMGRRKTDGSRTDLPAGTPVSAEGPWDPSQAQSPAHVHKAGPRGVMRDQTEILRRGVPYLTLSADGTLDAGLQFVSFQSSLDNFAVIFTRWMLNANFPSPNTGSDNLFARGLVTLLKGGFYVVPPADPRFLGASIFDPDAPDPCTVGRIVIRKSSVDQNNNPVVGELGGGVFEVIDAQTGAVVAASITTDSAGHAESPDLARGRQLILREITPPSGFTAAHDQAFVLTAHRAILSVVNVEAGSGPIYNP